MVNEYIKYIFASFENTDGIHFLPLNKDIITIKYAPKFLKFHVEN